MAVSDARGAETYLNSQLPGLVEKLREASRRRVADQLLFVGSVALSAALIAFGLAAIAAAVFGDWQGSGTDIAIAAGIGVLAGLATAALLLRRPKLGDLARSADFHFSLRERVSTAVQIVERGQHQGSPLGLALVSDVRARSGVVDPKRLAPFHWRRMIYPVLAAILFAGATAFLPAKDTEQSPVIADVQPAMTETETADLADDLRRVADLLREDAATRDDPFLAAIARDVEQLGAELEAAELPDRQALIEELERIADFTAEAYAGPGAAALSERGLTPLLNTMIQELGQGPPQRIAEETQPNNGNAAPGDPADPAAAPAANQAALDDMLAEAEAERLEDARPDVARPGGEGAGAVDGGYVEAAQQALAEAAEREPGTPQDIAGGQLAGAAANADQGGGFLAGEGVQPLNGAEEEVDPFEMIGELILEDELDGDGHRIRIEVPQQAADVDMPTQVVVAGAWQQLPEKEVNRQLLTTGQREAVARYFGLAAEELD